MMGNCYLQVCILELGTMVYWFSINLKPNVFTLSQITVHKRVYFRCWQERYRLYRLANDSD